LDIWNEEEKGCVKMYKVFKTEKFGYSGTVVPPPATVPENTCSPEKMKIHLLLCHFWKCV
jgi:hypothetical protein